jgi:hypothetical protein
MKEAISRNEVSSPRPGATIFIKMIQETIFHNPGQEITSWGIISIKIHYKFLSI